MAKSLRSKREKRLKAIRRDLVQPLVNKKDELKLAAQEAALAAPKLPIRLSSSQMELADATSTPVDTAAANNMDMEMADGEKTNAVLKVGKNSKRKFKVGKKGSKRTAAKGKIRRRHV
ncbi:hypothetical protein ACFE04_000092 [Oxalis oulophora]